MYGSRDLNIVHGMSMNLERGQHEERESEVRECECNRRECEQLK